MPWTMCNSEYTYVPMHTEEGGRSYIVVLGNYGLSHSCAVIVAVYTDLLLEYPYSVSDRTQSTI